MSTQRSALEIRAAIERGETTAAAVIEATLAGIARENGRLGAFTDMTAERARRAAVAIDSARASGHAAPRSRA